MLIKIVTLFLIGMGVLAMFGKLRLPGAKTVEKLRLSRPRKCTACGGFIVGSGPCQCKQKGRS